MSYTSLASRVRRLQNESLFAEVEEVAGDAYAQTPRPTYRQILDKAVAAGFSLAPPERFAAMVVSLMKWLDYRQAAVSRTGLDKDAAKDLVINAYNINPVRPQPIWG